MPRQKYSLQIIMRSSAAMQVVTTMTPDEIVAEMIEGSNPDAEFKATNERDEDVTVIVRREQVDGYIIGPFHPSVARPGLVQ